MYRNDEFLSDILHEQHVRAVSSLYPRQTGSIARSAAKPSGHNLRRALGLVLVRIGTRMVHSAEAV